MPIDNLLNRENWKRSYNTPGEHLQAVNEAQQHMFERVRKLRAERFERNKKAAGIDKPIPEYKVGEKAYLKFHQGRFRPIGGSTKLSKVNDGPYTVVKRLFDGLVYTVEHDGVGYSSNVSVTRMIPAGQMVVPADTADFPGRWKQWREDREDRLNDEIEEKEEQPEEKEVDTIVPKARQADPHSEQTSMPGPLVHPPPQSAAGDRAIAKRPQIDPFSSNRAKAAMNPSLASDPTNNPGQCADATRHGHRTWVHGRHAWTHGRCARTHDRCAWKHGHCTQASSHGA